MALCAESAVLGKGRRYLGTLEQHLPDVLVRRVEELSQRLVLGRVELPQIEYSSLTREDPAEGSSPSWTLRLPQTGQPSSSCLPRLGGEFSSSSSSFSWEECASELSDDESDITLRRRPFRVPVAFFLAFFTGTS